MCGFLVARVPFSECPVFPGELVEPQGGIPFSPGEVSIYRTEMKEKARAKEKDKAKGKGEGEGGGEGDGED